MWQNIRKQWGLQAFLNWLILKFMFAEMGRMIEETYLPLLRLLVDDKSLLLRDYQSLVDGRTKLPFYASPYQRWWTNYGNFIKENEFALRLLEKHLSQADFQELVVNYTGERIEKRFQFMKKAMQKVHNKQNLHAQMQSAMGRRAIPVINVMAQFLVGSMDAYLDEEGTLIMDIPDCAMHRSASDTEPMELSCLYSCKAACESVFSVNDPMCFDFEPHLPDFGCTLRVYMAGHPQLEARKQAREDLVNFIDKANNTSKKSAENADKKVA